MSGNVREMTTDNNSGSYYYPYGGSYTDAASDCTVTSRNTEVYYDNYSSYTGFRLILTLK